jgi:hypothetical protein
MILPPSPYCAALSLNHNGHQDRQEFNKEAWTLDAGIVGFRSRERGAELPEKPRHLHTKGGSGLENLIFVSDCLMPVNLRLQLEGNIISQA